MASKRQRAYAVVAVVVLFSAPVIGTMGTATAQTTTVEPTQNNTTVGGTIWSHSTSSGEFLNSPTLANNKLYIGGDNAELYAVNISSGEREWTFTRSFGAFTTSVDYFNGRVFTGRTNYFYSVQADSGSMNYYHYSGGGPQGVESESGTAYYTTNSGTLIALNTNTESELWRHNPSCSVSYSAPVMYSGNIIYATDCGSVYSINQDGTVDWSYDGGYSGIQSSPTVANGNVYLGAQDDRIMAINADSGTLNWEWTTGESTNVDTTPTVADGRVYFGATSGTLYAVDATSGEKAWEYDSENTTKDGVGIKSSPTYANGTVYVGTNEGKFLAVNAQSGELEWKREFGARIANGPVVANGVIYTATDSGTIYALQAGHSGTSSGTRIEQSVLNEIGPGVTYGSSPPDTGNGGNGEGTCLQNLSGIPTVQWLPCYLGTGILSTTFQWLITGLLVAYPIANKTNSDIGTMATIDGVLAVGMLVGPVSPAYVAIGIITTGLLASDDDSADVQITNGGI